MSDLITLLSRLPAGFVIANFWRYRKIQLERSANCTKEISVIKIRAGNNNCTVRETVQIYEQDSARHALWYTTVIIFVRTYGCAENICWVINMILFLSFLPSVFSISLFLALERDFLSFVPGSFFLYVDLFLCGSIHLCIVWHLRRASPSFSLSRLWQLHNFNCAVWRHLSLSN